MSFLSKIFGNKEPKEKSYDFYGKLEICLAHKVLSIKSGNVEITIEGDWRKCNDSCKYRHVDETKALKIMGWTGDEIWTRLYPNLLNQNPNTLPEWERKILTDCENRLGVKTEKQELEYFEKVTTKDSREATRILFEHALAAVPAITPQKAKLYYESVKRTFGSKVLVEGPRDKMQKVVLMNLMRLTVSTGGFTHFSIDAIAGDECAQVNANYPRVFTPVRVWKSKDRFFACGDPDFK